MNKRKSELGKGGERCLIQALLLTVFREEAALVLILLQPK